ncbi:MAG: phosphate regulon sensor histidine kinase PhoR [Gammaproteobacteria bacterium]|nr:phosphate regulon sensor histidine kinase PhoR [Gammaproteobacteria bacterium]
MIYRWVQELWQFIGLAVLVFVLGVIFGHSSAFLLTFFFSYLAWYFYNLVTLERWLRHGKKYSPPVSNGIWGHIFTELYHMQQRKLKRNKKLLKLLNRFRESTAALPEGVIVTREQGEIEWWNTTAGELLGLKYPQDVDQRINNLLRNPDVTEYCRNHKPGDVVVFKSPVNEDILLSLKNVPYGNKQKLVVVRDVTLFKRVEEMQRDFVANISHELRTPITVFSGYLENILADDQMDPEHIQHACKVMQQQALRMRQLTDDLTILSNVDNEKVRHRNEMVDVNTMLASLQEEAVMLSGDKHHMIIFEIQPDLYLLGDAKELDSVFTNLVVNAINYTPTGGAIRVRWFEDEDGAHFEVNDTGIGIAKYHLARLTERFYRIDVARSRNTGGSGLGLAIVKHALQRHQASLHIDSEIGRGSTFICHFPPEIILHKNEFMPPVSDFSKAL